MRHFDTPFGFIDPESIIALLVVGFIVLVLEILVRQKTFPRIAVCLQTLALFLMFAGAFISFFGRRFIFTDIASMAVGALCIGVGLVYSIRCMQLEWFASRWFGRLFSWVFMMLFLWLFLAGLDRCLPDWFPANNLLLSFAWLFAFLIALGLWAIFLHKLQMRSLPRRANPTTEPPPFREPDA